MVKPGSKSAEGEISVYCLLFNINYYDDRTKGRTN